MYPIPSLQEQSPKVRWVWGGNMSFKKYDGSTWHPITPKKLKGIPYTGTLPAVLTGTKAGYLYRYKVYGNMGENLYNKNDSSMNFNGFINTNGTVMISSLGSFSIIVPVKTNTTYTIVKPATSRFRVGLFTSYPYEGETATTIYGDRSGSGFDYGTSLTFTTSNDTSYILAFIRNYDAAGTTNEQMKNSTMVLEGSIPSESYIPHEECGERTVNLFNSQDVAIGKYIASDGTETTSVGTGDLTLNHSAMVAISPLTAYTFSINKSTENTAVDNAFCWFDENGMIITRDLFDAEYWETKITKTYQSPSNATFLMINFRGTTDKFASGMIVEGSIVPSTYEPYGYKLPLTSAGQDVDIYIGDETLSTDEYVDSGTGKIYRMVSGVLTPVDPPIPFPQIPTSAGSTAISWAGEGLAPSEFDSIQEWVDIPTYKRVNGAWVEDN